MKFVTITKDEHPNNKCEGLKVALVEVYAPKFEPEDPPIFVSGLCLDCAKPQPIQLLTEDVNGDYTIFTMNSVGTIIPRQIEELVEKGQVDIGLNAYPVRLKLVK
jgi:hypothetical protein